MASIFILATVFIVQMSRHKSVQALAAAPAPEGLYYVALQGNGAVPSEVLIKTGESVEFDSKDGKMHNIASGKGNDYHADHDHESVSGVESGVFAPDEGYKVKFSTPGVYYFHDHLDPSIAITVAVYDPQT